VYEKERRVLPGIAKAMRDGIMPYPASVEAQRHNGAIQKGGSSARRSLNSVKGDENRQSRL
jgi:hypothetical protein